MMLTVITVQHSKAATIAQLDPTIMELARDVWLNNINEPGMKTVAERSRSMQIKNGIIPFEQLTDEEQQQAQQQANQPPQPDPNMLIAEAEMGKAQAEQLSAQTKQEEAQGNMQLKAATLQLENRKLALAEQEQQLDVAKFQREKDDKYNVDAANIQQNQQKIDNTAQAQAQQLALKLTELELKFNQQLDKELEQNVLVFDPATGDFSNASR